jgi:hypothetical protein
MCSPINSAIGIDKLTVNYAPRAFGKRAHHHVAEASERDHDDEEHGHGSHGSEHGPEFAPCDLCQRLAVPSHTRNQDHEVVHGAAQYHPEDDPQKPWQETKLCGHTGPIKGPHR